MMMAETTDHEDTCRGIPHHLPVPAPGDPVDLKEREREVFRAEFSGPLSGKLDLFFLNLGQSGVFGHLHDPSLTLRLFPKDIVLSVPGEFFDRDKSRYSLPPCHCPA